MSEILRRSELPRVTPSYDVQGILFVGGLGSFNSCELRPVAQAVQPLVPDRSLLVLQDFTFGFNGAPMGPMRTTEERRTAETVEELAAKTGNPVIIFGESLGGLIAIGAGNRQPDNVSATVLLGTPATDPYIGFPKLVTKHQTVYSIHGGHDPLAPVDFAPRGANVRVAVLPGIDHLSLKGRAGIAAVTEAFAAILPPRPKILVGAQTRAHP